VKLNDRLLTGQGWDRLRHVKFFDLIGQALNAMLERGGMTLLEMQSMEYLMLRAQRRAQISHFVKQGSHVTTHGSCGVIQRSHVLASDQRDRMELGHHSETRRACFQVACRESDLKVPSGVCDLLPHLFSL